MNDETERGSIINGSDDQIRGDQEVKNMVYANNIDGVATNREDHRVTTGMEAAKRYISSLSANATEAQLPNHGLLVIPLFNTFESLKILNLSGNAIVRIPAGALPPRLHSLNLSKNNIFIIEGLRKLTRLRVLDLSYNRIRRIGHGLASCYSLKELYLAGNKISEVEGLHRLLKLSILDIRFNEISSAKCLGQLVANYNSLQAISLDGNPTHNSVEDEQLKKYLKVILPHLVYYNGHPIKVNTLKDAADESVQFSMNSYQFDRVLRLDNKTIKKANQGVVAAQRPSTTSTRARRDQTVNSSKLSKGKHNNTDLLPPSEAEVSIRSRYYRRLFWFPLLI
ncbi:protein phosphatase 1 regulatory subunit SDS22-like [Abrus precatorius]|uniref:Protein phosphatase 1 regulatory subunit SDS22-like n=1 Tax=Abrus precatorius TaxID=3816 RepID=A0A8B8KXX5_ABRPR|nr:protein phosphatase 1 regulatory subunit SDS22-like [Abrus precatorius]